MSSVSSSGRSNPLDIEEISQIGTRCKELKKEKDVLNASQSESFHLIRRLEQYVKTLLEAQKEDKYRIEELERELCNCSQEIDYLQDQLNARNKEVHCLGDHVHVLELKLAEMENLEEMVGNLTEEVKKSDSERLFLNDELQNKEMEFQKSTLCIESLEESILSVSLEYQCEIESIKIDLMALEQSCFEANKIKEEAVQEKRRLAELIECLEEENNEIREKLETSEINAREFCRKMEETFPEWMGKDDQSSSSELEKDTRTTGDILGPLLYKLVVGRASGEMATLSCRIREYEVLVGQLKAELKEAKLKANEEAEDLAQEMAELRYQITGLLEEECKRRAYVEQISLHRIAELEAQIEKGQNKSFNTGSIVLKLED